MMPTLDVRHASRADAAAARHLARRLGLPWIGADALSDRDLTLHLAAGVLSLRDNRGRRLKPLSVDFDTPESASRKQLLGRAVGHRTRSLVDATAGWGDDARRLCAMGYQLTAVERSPVMAALLENAAARAVAGAVPEVVADDAIEYLARHPGRWDCVYLDPMFPPRRRSSTLSRRRLRLLRELVGDDGDRARLFHAARDAARIRVVVKRPDHHPALFDEPAQTLAGKLVCYDVYFT